MSVPNIANPQESLRRVKVLHTVIWAFFATCILATPVAAALGELRLARGLVAIVSIEVVVLLVNGLKCPLTGIAARYTPDRQDNFDIYLPLWLARHNKLIFGSLYVAGVAYTLVLWHGVRAG
jgi:hypothetical protein